jgi:hypothetical protein
MATPLRSFASGSKVSNLGLKFTLLPGVNFPGDKLQLENLELQA